MNATSARASNYWVDERFAQIGDLLAEKYSARIVLFGAPADMEKCENIAAHMKTRPLLAAGKLNIASAVALVSRLDLLITVHSALLHAANAAEIPFIGLMSLENNVKDGPYRPKAGSFILIDSVLTRQPRPQSPCMENITVAQVFDAAQKLLGAPV